MQIGEVAGRVGLSPRTIRHWDEVGLVVPSARSVGGFRLYTDADVERIVLVKSLKPLELGLDQISDLLATMDAVAADDGHDERATEQLLRRLTTFRIAADGRVEALRAQVQALESLSRRLRSLATESARRRRTG